MRACASAVSARRVWHRIPAVRQRAFQRVETRRQLVVAIAVELDAQQRAGIGVENRAAQGVERGALARVIEDEAIHHFDCRRTMLQDRGHRRERVEQMLELDGQHRLGGGQRHQIEARFDDQAERAFGADDQLRQIERARRFDELIEVVAADAAEHFGEAAIDFRGTVSGQPPNRAIGSRFKAIAGARGVEPDGIERPKVRDLTVCEHDVQIEHVVDRLAVNHRARAARVVADHAANRRAAGRRHIRCEAQPVRPELRVQHVEHDTRLDPRPALGGVHFEHAIEVFRRIELESVPDGLARLRRAAAAGRDRARVPPRDPDGADDILARPHDHDAGRLDLVDAGIRRIQRTRDRIEADIPLDLVSELASKLIVQAANCTGWPKPS